MRLDQPIDADMSETNERDGIMNDNNTNEVESSFAGRVESATPTAWVGCLACYNAGELTGEWLEGEAVTEYVCPNDSTHKEMWVMDHEGLRGLVTGEMSPDTFYVYAAFIEQHGDNEAVFAYMSGNSISIEDFDEDAFDDCYMGEYENGIRGYVEEEILPALESSYKLDRVYVLNSISIMSYIDVDAIAHDLDCSGWWTSGDHVFDEN